MYKIVVDGFHYEHESLNNLIAYLIEDYRQLFSQLIKCESLNDVKLCLELNGRKVQ